MAWFRDTFGFDELDKNRNPTPVYANFTYEAPWLYCAANNTRHHAGTLTQVSLASMWDQAARLGWPNKSEDNEGSKHRLQAGPCVLDIVHSDVASLHADPTNAGAVFMVASQFNCLEFSHFSQTPEQGVTIYANDRTQGPACSLCCGAGTVIRNYFCFDKAPRASSGQTSSNMINNLCDIERLLNNNAHQYFRVHHGYTFGTHNSLARLTQRLQTMTAQEKTDLKRSLRVGLLQGTQVSGTKYTVTQVLASAISCSSSEATPQAWELFARLILEGAYEFTLLAAANLLQQGLCSPHVYLTLLGSGAFANPSSWSVDAIASALRLVQHVPLRVHIVLFRQAPSQELQRLVQTWEP